MSKPEPQAFDRFYSSADGLRLHYLEWRGPDDGAGARAPVVCLPGLARSAEDFRALAGTLARGGRRVLALDYRGRGESQWDPDFSHYSLEVEQEDIARMFRDAGVAEAAIVGTSRGGLHAMLLAQARPGCVRAAVLNDIGPEISLDGLLAIKRYVGRLPPLASMEDALGLMRLSAGAIFSSLTQEQWRDFARQTFMEKGGKVVPRYDPALSHTLDEVAPGYAPPQHWTAFAALARKPLLTLRGESSNILTPQILQEMSRRAPTMEIHVVPGQGHPPLLLDAETIACVAGFLARCG
jgi:pimeloyl-ACP methyl ester carboxylesterase